MGEPIGWLNRNPEPWRDWDPAAKAVVLIPPLAVAAGLGAYMLDRWLTQWLVLPLMALVVVVFFLLIRPLPKARRLAREAEEALDFPRMANLDERILLGPVSEWIAEGEYRAIRDWEAKHSKPRPASQQWVKLYHPAQGATHSVPDNPGVVTDFQRRGWVAMEPPADISGIEMPEIR